MKVYELVRKEGEPPRFVEIRPAGRQRASEPKKRPEIPKNAWLNEPHPPPVVVGCMALPRPQRHKRFSPVLWLQRLSMLFFTLAAVLGLVLAVLLEGSAL